MNAPAAHAAVSVAVSLLLGAGSVSATPAEALRDVAAEAPVSAEGDEPSIRGAGDGDGLTFTGTETTQTASSVTDAGTPPTHVPALVERRIPVVVCGTESGLADAGAPCVEGASDIIRSRVCTDGSEALPPLWRRAVDPATGLGVGPWDRIDDGYCSEDGTAVVLTAEEFRRLPLAASVPTIQPPGGRALVNKDLIVFTDPTPQELTTVILGTPLQVRASPVGYAWDFGDGSATLVTTDPGRAFPNQTVAHLYEAVGTFEVRLVTTWQGVYQVAGAGPWLAVAGTAETASAPYSVGIEEARTYLVQDSQG